MIPLESAPAVEPAADPVVFVVDDDASVRDSLALMIRQAGARAELFATARDFLQRRRADAPSCLVLDISLPGLTGLDLQRQLDADQARIPIIFITGYGDVPTTVRAMKAGAFEFLTKPFDGDVLLEAMRKALERSRVTLRDLELDRALLRKYETLTKREREVMALVVAGLLNKQIGAKLGTSEITVKAHRGKVMRKMNAASLADLVRTAGRLDSMRRIGVDGDFETNPFVSVDTIE